MESLKHIFTFYVPFFMSLGISAYAISNGFYFWLWFIPFIIILIFCFIAERLEYFVDSLKGDMSFIIWYFILVGLLPVINLSILMTSVIILLGDRE